MTDLRSEVFRWIETERHPSWELHLRPGGQFWSGLNRVPDHEKLGFEELLIALRERLAGRRDPCHLTLRVLRDACSRLLWHRQTLLTLAPAYRNFAAWLREHHGNGQPNAIVSLNWDLVAEAALQYGAVPWRYNSGTCCVPILKPHGSINWSNYKDRGLVAQSPDWELIAPSSPFSYIPRDPFFDPFGSGVNQRLRQVIFPGDSENEDGIAKIWDEASKAIQEREVVVFIGYSLPPYDSEASKFLRDSCAGKRIEVCARSRATLDRYRKTFGDLATKDALGFASSPYARPRREKAGNRA
ncbi:MAG: hypothetical protein ACRD2B_12540 [Terriglobia bacterium]